MTDFKRAKSEENKKIRRNEIMQATDLLFHQLSYHDFGLKEIAQKANIARSGLYKYFTSKEEIFLAIYLEKQKQTVTNIINDMSHSPHTTGHIAHSMATHLFHNLDYIRYHQILNAIIETNVSIESLAEFKKISNDQRQPLYMMIKEIAKLDSLNEAFDVYLTILYHSVYLYDRIINRDIYVQAMKLAQLEIVPIDFEEKLTEFIVMCFKYQRSIH